VRPVNMRFKAKPPSLFEPGCLFIVVFGTEFFSSETLDVRR
jgi:hypothetical protein